MDVVITGGAGFLGSRLARELLAAGSVAVAGGEPRPLSRVRLVDQAPVPPGWKRCRWLTWDLLALALAGPRGRRPVSARDPGTGHGRR